MTNATKRDIPWDVRGAFDKIVGKRIKGVVIKEAYPSPDAQIFILFADNTYFEIYGGEMHGAKDVYKGGLDEVKSYMAGKGRGITFERVDESIKDTDISNSTVLHADECGSTRIGSPTLIKRLMLRSMQSELSLKTIKSAIPSEEDLLIIYDDAALCAAVGKAPGNTSNPSRNRSATHKGMRKKIIVASMVILGLIAVVVLALPKSNIPAARLDSVGGQSGFESYAEAIQWYQSQNLETMQPSSESIFKASYHTRDEVLLVYFQSNPGKAYIFGDVPRDIWEDFKSAASKGGYFNSRIKNRYRFSLKK